MGGGEHVTVRNEGSATPGRLAVTGDQPHLPGQLIHLGLLASDNPHRPGNNDFKLDSQSVGVLYDLCDSLLVHKLFNLVFNV